MTRLLRLLPAPQDECEVQNLYLQYHLQKLGKPHAPFVYANFLSSLDGRVAVTEAHANSGISATPESLISANDLRLLYELQAQADCIVTNSAYLRSLASEQLGNVLQVGVTPDTQDLARWRAAQGLAPQPAVVVASSSLDFVVPPSLREHKQTLYVATCENADRTKLRRWQRLGIECFFAGKGDIVEGEPLIAELGKLGYRSIYLLAGPTMLATMLDHGQLSRLYLTMTHQLVGRRSFHTMINGEILNKGINLRLRSLYYDEHSPTDAGQWFSEFEPAY